jgi:uncharacterized membrane protein YkvA (DUF1232 family)
MTNGRRVAAAVLVGLGALVYGISPIDIIPELLTGPLGFIDDLGILGVAGFAIYKLLTGRSPGGAAPKA